MLRQVLIAILTMSFPSGLAQAGSGPIALERGLALEGASVEAGSAQPSEAQTIRSLGFDFVSLPAEPAHSGAVALARTERRVRALTDAGLRVAVRVKPGKGKVPYTDVEREGIVHLASALNRIGADAAALALTDELGSRFCKDRDAKVWAKALSKARVAVRQAAPDLTLIVSGVCGDIHGLVRLDPEALADRNLIYSFDFFEPERFTKQGVGAARDVKGAPWPADDVAIDLALIFSKLLLSREDLTPDEYAERISYASRHIAIYMVGNWEERHIQDQFAKLGAWAAQHGIPERQLLLGAFGAVGAAEDRGGALDSDRHRWLRAVSRQADALGIAWTFNSFGNVDPLTIDALGMPQRAALPVEPSGTAFRQ